MDWITLLMGGRMCGPREIDSLRSACRSAARRHAREAGDAYKRLDDLEEWIAELALMNQALFRLLLERGAFTIDHFNQVLKDVDLLDGVEDGKLAKPPLDAREGLEEAAGPPERKQGAARPQAHGKRRPAGS